jgi:hypothetical protein
VPIEHIISRSPEEVKTAPFAMAPNKSPAVDGSTAGFFQTQLGAGEE